MGADGKSRCSNIKELEIHKVEKQVLKLIKYSCNEVIGMIL